MAIRRLELSAVKPTMFHVSPAHNLRSIKSKGLRPAKTPSPHSMKFGKYVANSIYFSSTVQSAMRWIQMLSTGADDRLTDPVVVRNFVVLKVDVSEWHDAFVVDPAFKDSSGEADAYILTGVTVPAKNIQLVPMTDDMVEIALTGRTFSVHDLYRAANLPAFIDALPVPRQKTLRLEVERVYKAVLKDIDDAADASEKRFLRREYKDSLLILKTSLERLAS